MKLKDLFQSTKTLQSSSLEDIARELESQEYIESYNKDKVRFLPNVDYSDPRNFAYFGSAEKYYSDSFGRIRGSFPYDGSEKEKYDWIFESTFIDLYLYEERYPRFNGYANMGYPTWGTLSGSLIGGYGKSTTNTFIKTFGGPNDSSLRGLGKQFGDANKLDNSKSRESNFKYKLEDGVTIEMWIKKPTFDTSKTEKEVLFDLWNGEASSSAQYGRLRLELTGASSGSPFLFTALSGTNGTQHQSCGQNVTTASVSDWTHISLTLKNSGSDLSANFYLNGQFNQQQTISNAALGEVTGSLISYIGALQTAPSGASTVQAGAGKFSGSIDEFRYWKSERTSKEIGRHYWTNIGGGTNTDEANTKLGVYYKFNEGITQISSYDSAVLDYSGRVSNGSWTGYQSGARSTDSAMVLAGAAAKEYKDPVIYSTHPDYITILGELESSGSVYDISNNASLINSVPGWILEDDGTKEGNLRNLTHMMASYYDNLFLHIKELNSLKNVYSHFQTDQINQYNTTSTTGSVKPLPFADRLLTNVGFVAPELFADASVLEALADRSEDEHYEMKINDVKNQIYQNVYSSLVNTYKEKGTNKAFRNILHSFGIDEDVVKINFYGNNVDFELEDRYTIRATKEKMVDFNSPDRFMGSIYQYASGTNSVSFISGSGGNFEKYIPVTLETQVVLPNKLEWDKEYGYDTSFTKSVILGMHEADGTDGTDYSIPGTDYAEMQMYSVRDQRESKRVKFHLSSSVLGVHLSSSLYDDMYMNNEWVFAFKIRNEKYPTTDLVLSSSVNSNYIVDFIGYNTDASTTIHSFHLSSSIAATNAHNFLNSSKRIYAGAKRTNFTGSLVEPSDHKIGFVRYWMSDLTNDTIQRHAYNSRNYGANSPIRSAYLMEDSINDIKVPEIDTLILNWDFETLSKSDANGQFIALDVTSGSGEQRYIKAFEDIKRKFYHGKGDFFLINDEKVIDVEYVNAARSTYPEILQGDDMIEIRTQDDLQFTRNTLPQDYYIAFEKSMAQTISEEMIKFMSSVKDFNNLIGRPVDKYRQEYKDLRNLRQLFFERVSNEPDLDKYVDYYKWLDDSLGEMLVALVPASLAHSDGINNVIENYVFSRDKYDHKFPTIEFKTPVLEGGMNTINRHLYPWKQGHAPVGATPENENCFWWLERAERDQPPLSSSDAGVVNSRVKVFQARSSVLNRSFTTAQHFDVDRGRAIHGGTNYDDNKKRDYIWSATKEVSESPATYGQFGAFPLRYVIANNDMFQSLKDCDDDRPVTEKIKRAFSAVDGFMAFHHDMSGNLSDGIFKGGMVMPFNIMSSSALSGYSELINGIPGAGENINITNLHSDTTDNTNDVPMQSPFTERWVGGHQHRHSPVNRGTDSEATRGEGYKILINNIENSSGSIGIAGADYPYPYASQDNAPFFKIDQAKARYYREERAKRPVNTKNIQTTGSQVGNYQKNYQYVHTFGATQNKTFFRSSDPAANLHNTINSRLPETNLEASLVARGVGGEGNVASNFNTSSLYLGGVKTSTTLTSGAIAGRSVISSRFSAPGGFETMSEIFLDKYAKEHSAYNALPFRNLQVRGLSSGENGTIRLVDIHGNRYGLLTHLTRHSAQGGVDSVLGGDSPSFHKVNRNAKWDASEQAYDYDNYWIQHQIPQSDYQYKWVKASHTASYATSSLAGHILSDYTEPSGTSSRLPIDHINNIVINQSVINQRITGTTAYGFPSWEQIRNNDRTKNILLKKAYGYSIENTTTSESITAEESRVTMNVPNTVDIRHDGSEFQFKYPYVNMKYHFDSLTLRNATLNEQNETLYESLYGFYSSQEDEVQAFKKNIKQVIFPRYVKHTKYSTRHRHFFKSHFWAKGENTLYNPIVNETGSYSRLDEEGRRETNVTASLFGINSLNKQADYLINDGYLNNIIPSQSIWSMDSRTNFTSSSPQTAASNSAGAPGVLQNQDHHFHNGISEFQLLQSGSVATGSFALMGATRFGEFSSGSFTVQGMQPTGIAASGSFEITGANVQGTSATGEFTTSEAFAAATSASYAFTAGSRTVLGSKSSGSFAVSGAFHAATVASATFDVAGLPVGGERSFAIFDLAYEVVDDGHKFKLGRNGDADYFEIDLDDSVTGTNTAIPLPLVYQKAAPLTGSMIISGSITRANTSQLNEEFVFTAWTKIANGSLHSDSKKYLYYNESTAGTRCTELFFDDGSTTADQGTLIFVKHHDSSGTPGSWTFKWNNLGALAAFAPDDAGISPWQQITLVYRDKVGTAEVPFIRLYINNTLATAPSSTGVQAAIGHTLNIANRHYVMSHPSTHEFKNGTQVDISDMQILSSGSIDVAQTDLAFNAKADSISTNFWQAGKFAPIAMSASQTIAKYVFGDGASGDVSDDARAGTNRIFDVNTSTTNHLNLAQNLYGTAFTNSRFANKKYTGVNQHTSWFDDVLTSIRSDNSNSSYFDIDYVAHTQTASADYDTSYWYPDTSVDGTRGVSPKNDSLSGFVLIDQVINYARFYAVAKVESAASNYTLAPVVNNGLASGQQASFTLLENLTTGSTEINSVGGSSIEHTGISIDGTIIRINHHNNSQGGNQVETFAATYLRCISGSATDYIKFHNDAYPATTALEPTDDISISFWWAAASATEGVLQLDSATGNSTFGALSIYSTSTALFLRAYDGTDYKYWKVNHSAITNVTDLNHYCFTFDVSNAVNDSSLTLYVNGSSTPLFSSETAGFSTFSHTYTKLVVAGIDGSPSYELRGKLCEVSLWDTILDASDVSEIYHDGRIKNLNRHEKVKNLVHWYRLGQESDITALSVSDNLSTIATIPDASPRSVSVPLTVNLGSSMTVENGLPDNTITDSTFRTNLNTSIGSNVANFNAANTDEVFTVSYTSAGTVGNGKVLTEDSLLITNKVSPTAGGTDASGSVSNDQLDIGGINFIADTASRSSSSPDFYIDATSTDSAFWNALSASIKVNTVYDTVTISGTGTERTLSLTSSVTGSDQNKSMSVEVGTSFGSVLTPAGGTSETGAEDGHWINLRPNTLTATARKFIVDKDNDGVDNTPTNSRYLYSVQASNTNWWNEVKTTIEAEGYSVVYVADSPTAGTATFTVTNYITASDGNSGATNVTSGGTFAASAGTSFAGGTDDSGAANGDTVTVDSITFEIVHVATSSITQIQAAGVSNDVFWESLRTKISAQTGFAATIGSDNPRTFTLTSVATGAAENPSISEVGSTFEIVSAGVDGTTEAGAENGDTITIDGQTFAINLSSGLGTGSNSQFHDALRTEIIASTDFDTITTTTVGSYVRFDLTSSVTGTAKNVAFVQNSNGIRTTFQNLAGAAGGTSPIGIGDLDAIRFRDEENSRDRFFAVDAIGDEVDGTPANYIYIDTSAYTGTDNEKSIKFWNDLSSSIISSTAFKNITITSDNNVGTFHITSSITGTLYNGDISQVYNNDDGVGFAMLAQTAGGIDESGATAGNTIAIEGTTFTIVHDISPTATQVNASGVSDTAFFDSLAVAVQDNTSFSASYVVSSNTASYSLTSSVTGTAKNQTMTEVGNSFTTLVGTAGGVNGIFRGVKFGEVIPQPRYNYPHILQSPGSLRSPSDKSNLGLIDQDYKLRSNHYALTRSLGYSTDGLYDNTSRWTTPDLSGLTPMDDDYNVWYERIRGSNKHFSLVPEFRISSHIKNIISSGSDERKYFAQNYWLEITGASFDNGQTVARNNRGSSSEFLNEYSTTTNIKDIDQFIEDNVIGMGMLPVKLTLTCDAIKSFLPYEGFYPQTRTVQMCEAFAESYGKGIIADEANPDDTNLNFPDNNILAQARPIFDAVMSPGLLFNTIKSGMAVDYPIVTSKMATASLRDPYGGINHMISNEYFEDRLPFETLIKPEAYMSNKFIVDMNPHPSSSFNLKAKIGNATNPNYKLMANNFFSEVMEFFLQEGKSSKLVSKPDTDPDFGIVTPDSDGTLPIFKSIFRVFKSRKQHPYIEFSGAADIIASSTDTSGAFDKYHNRPPSGTNYFLKEYQGLTGSNLEYDVAKVSYPRPQINPYAEVGTITMYSQPNAFGPPCAGGVAVEYSGRDISKNALTGDNNNTTYMMYDSTNGYNAPFTPPYYDGEAWAVYTFTPLRAGKHRLDEILENTKVEFLRYELNHESGSYGDRGTFGPQGFSINDNAMQVDASFNLFKQAVFLQGNNTSTATVGDTGINIGTNVAAGKAWIIESKFETPILDFSKYLNREYNAEFESGVTSDDIYTSRLSLSGTRQEADTLSAVHSSLSTVHELSGILNPIGMWHQHGEFPTSPDKGIFMQIMDMPLDYQRLGSEMTIPNPKYATVKPEIASCDGAGLESAYNQNARDTMYPYFKKQVIKRRLVGDDEFAVEGGAIQIVNLETDIIIDTELRYEELQSIYGYELANTGTVAENFKLFDVFKDTSSYTVGSLTTGSDFTASSIELGIYLNGTASTDYNASSSSPFKGHWAASYYHYDREDTYAPLMVTTKNFASLGYDYGTFSKGFFEDFLRDFSIGVSYSEQSTRFSDATEVDCIDSPQGTVLTPSVFKDALEKNNNNITIGNLSKINMTDSSRVALGDLIGSNIVSASPSMTQEAIKVNTAISSTRAGTIKFKNTSLRKKTFRLIPDNPSVSALASSDTSSYNYPEPMFVRGAIRYNAGTSSATSNTAQRSIGYFNKMPQYAPQSDKNITSNPSTIRWGQFMHGDNQGVRSLADLVGFSQDAVKMGVTAKSRTIAEALVAIPYLEKEDGTPEYLTLDNDIVNKYLKDNSIVQENRSENDFLNVSELTDDAIKDQVNKMQKYVLPPHIDFISYDVQPLPMYIFEFKKNLDRDDLNNLWQGVRSENMKKVQFEQKQISHVLNVESLLGGIKERDINMTSLKDIRWRIFKVKQKANFFYNSKMKKDINSLGALTQSENSEFDNQKYGYNWPYDYFSLVENVQVKVDIELIKPIDFATIAELPVIEGGSTSTPQIGSITDPISVLPLESNIGNLVSQPEILENENESTFSEMTIVQRDIDISTGIVPNTGLGGGIDGRGTPDMSGINMIDLSNDTSDVQGSGGVDDGY